MVQNNVDTDLSHMLMDISWVQYSMLALFLLDSKKTAVVNCWLIELTHSSLFHCRFVELTVGNPKSARSNSTVQWHTVIIG